MIKNKNFFNKIILFNSSGEIRDSFSRIILNCLLSLYNEESKYLKEEFSKFVLTENSDNFSFITVKVYKSCVMRFFKNNILEEFDSIRSHWSRFNQFLFIMSECFNSMLFELVELSIYENIFDKIVLMIMNNTPGYETNLPTMGTKNIEVSFSILLDILSNIMQSKF